MSIELKRRDDVQDDLGAVDVESLQAVDIGGLYNFYVVVERSIFKQKSAGNKDRKQSWLQDPDETGLEVHL